MLKEGKFYWSNYRIQFSNLAQFLARREDYMEEAEIMFMFEQMLSAVSYLHDNNVLHRSFFFINLYKKLFQWPQNG